MSDGHRSATDLEGTVSGEPLAVRMTSMADLMLRRAEPHRLCLSTSDLKSMRTLSINGEEERRSTLQLLNRHWISSAALADSLRESRAAGQPVFVLDCRSAVDFGKCHIVDAINVSLPSILYKRLLKGSLHPSAVVSAKETREKFLAAYRTALIVLISHADKQQSSRNRADSLDSVLDTPSVPFVPHDNSISPLPHLCLASFSGLSASVGPLPGGSQCDQDVGGNPVGGDVAMLICNRLVEEKCEVAVLSDDFQLFAEQNEDLVVGYRNPKKTAADTFLTSNGVPHSREESLSSPLDLTHLQLSSEAAEETSDQQTIAAGCQGSEDSSYSSSLSSSGRSSDSGTPTEEKKAKLTPPRANGQRTATPLAAVPLRHHHCPPLVAVDPTSFSSEVEAVGDDYEKPSGSHPTSNFPVEIIPYLFLGNALNSADLETLERYGIRYILNVTPNLPNVFEQNKLFKYFQIPITDHWSQNIAQYFQAAIDFIDEGRHQQCGVLVHCLAGISRSVTIVVAYLMMRHRSMTLDAAYDLVKAQKPNISPNFNFMGQLLDWQTQLQTGVAASPKRCQCGSDETGGGCVVCSTNGKTQRHFISSPIALRSDGGAEL